MKGELRKKRRRLEHEKTKRENLTNAMMEKQLDDDFLFSDKKGRKIETEISNRRAYQILDNGKAYFRKNFRKL